jgi:hypothetical protein
MAFGYPTIVGCSAGGEVALVKKKKRGGGLEVSPLAAHKQKGKLLQPPMNQIGGMLLSSWVNEVLPEMLWV